MQAQESKPLKKRRRKTDAGDGTQVPEPSSRPSSALDAVPEPRKRKKKKKTKDKDKAAGNAQIQSLAQQQMPVDSQRPSEPDERPKKKKKKRQKEHSGANGLSTEPEQRVVLSKNMVEEAQKDTRKKKKKEKSKKPGETAQAVEKPWFNGFAHSYGSLDAEKVKSLLNGPSSELSDKSKKKKEKTRKFSM